MLPLVGQKRNLKGHERLEHVAAPQQHDRCASPLNDFADRQAAQVQVLGEELANHDDLLR